MASQARATSTGSLAATTGAQAIAIGCSVTDVQLVSNGTVAATMQIYDGKDTTGVMLANLSIPASTATPQFMAFNIPVYADKGVYYVITGTGATGIIHYTPGA